MSPRRGRGRPLAAEAGDTREEILRAARTLFADNGLAATSLRRVARTADVDPALVRHYFTDKASLFVASMDLPVDPLEKLAGAVAGGRDGLGERLVRSFVGIWDAQREVFRGLARNSLGATGGHSPVADFVREVVATRVASVLEGEDVELRSALVGTHLFGLGVARYLIALEPVASASVERLVRWYAPAIQTVVDG